MAFQVKTFEQIISSMADWTVFTVNKIADMRVGSVIRTILEALAMELEELYWRTYNSLLSTQEESVYTVFDFPRQPAQPNTVIQTFYTDQVGNDIVIPKGTLVSDGTLLTYETLVASTITTQTSYSDDMTYIAGTDIYYFTQRRVFSITSVVSNSVTFVQNVDYELVEFTDDEASYLYWIPGHNRPNTNDGMVVTYNSYSVDVPVMCNYAGVVGNVESKVITMMKNTITGVVGTTNFEASHLGTDAETNNERKQRFASYIDGLSKGTIPAIKYAIANDTKTYKVTSSLVMENVPSPGYILIFVADSSGEASEPLLSDVRTTVDEVRGAGITISVQAATRVNIDVYCKLRINANYVISTIINKVSLAIQSHLSSYTFPEDSNLSTVYLSNLIYVVKSVDPQAIIEADISFKRSDVTNDDYNNPSSANFPVIDDIAPTIGENVSEIFRAGTITVGAYDA